MYLQLSYIARQAWHCKLVYRYSHVLLHSSSPTHACIVIISRSVLLVFVHILLVQACMHMQDINALHLSTRTMGSSPGMTINVFACTYARFMRSMFVYIYALLRQLRTYNRVRIYLSWFVVVVVRLASWPLHLAPWPLHLMINCFEFLQSTAVDTPLGTCGGCHWLQLDLVACSLNHWT